MSDKSLNEWRKVLTSRCPSCGKPLGDLHTCSPQAPAEARPTPRTDASEQAAALDLRKAGFMAVGFCRVLDMQDLERDLTALREQVAAAQDDATRLHKEKMELWEQINLPGGLREQVERLRRERDETNRKDAMMRLNNAHFAEQWVRLCKILGVDKIAIMDTVDLVRSRIEQAEQRADTNWTNLRRIFDALPTASKPTCRDCADHDGRCPYTNSPCDPVQHAIELIQREQAAREDAERLDWCEKYQRFPSRTRPVTTAGFIGWTCANADGTMQFEALTARAAIDQARQAK